MQPENRFVSLKDIEFDESNVRGCPESHLPTSQPAQLEPKVPGRIKVKVRPRAPPKKVRNLKSLKPVKDFLTIHAKPDYKYLSKTGRYLYDDRYVQKPRPLPVPEGRPQREKKKTWRACASEEAPSEAKRPSKKPKLAEEPSSKAQPTCKKRKITEELSSEEEPAVKKPKNADSCLPTPPDSPPQKNKKLVDKAVDKVVDPAVNQAVDETDDADYETYCHLATLMWARLQQH